jgi:hypothetical protein
MCQVAHFSDVDVDDDHAEWTGDSRYVRPFNIRDLFAYEDADDTVDFEMELDPDDDDSDDDIDMDGDDEDDDE